MNKNDRLAEVNQAEPSLKFNMTIKKILLSLTVSYLLTSCSGEKLEEKGFPVSTTSENKDEDKDSGIYKDSLALLTSPSNVLLTSIPQYRLATIYKINVKDDKTTFIGSNDFHYNYEDIGKTDGNQWHENLIPGLEAVYGYNMVNISHFDNQNQKQKTFFEKPVLIKTLYYPTFSKDTLNYKPVIRNYYLTSVYDDDTNKDGFINIKDLRRFYYYDINANNKQALVPANYSVYKSEYDPANDFMYVFAQLDENGNGKIEDREATHIFWIDLNNPIHKGRQY